MDQPVARKKLVVVVGATAVGKTEVAVKLAHHFDCGILSADSRQCYHELGVATAKPSNRLLSQVEHYFVNSHSIAKPVSVAEYEQYALNILGQAFTKHHHFILTGGSGLYIKAVVDGLDPVPDIAHVVRERLEYRLQHQGLPTLVDQLKTLDPDALNMVDTQNPRRVVRALEVCIGTGKPYTSFLMGSSKFREFETVKIGLKRERDDLYQRINSRMDNMIAGGLFEEAKQLYEFKGKTPLQTVGYQEVFGYLDGQYDRQEAIRLLKRNSRRYAKRQLTWFGKDPDIKWFQADDVSSVVDYLDEWANG